MAGRVAAGRGWFVARGCPPAAGRLTPGRGPPAAARGAEFGAARGGCGDAEGSICRRTSCGCTADAARRGGCDEEDEDEFEELEEPRAREDGWGTCCEEEAEE